MTERVPVEREAKAGDCIVVYSIATGRVRRWYASNRDNEIKGVDIADGEAVLHVDAERGLTLPILQDRVTQASGKRPQSDRYVLIDPDGKIVSSLVADPTCGDKAEHFGLGYALVQHDTADERWSYSHATRTFTAPPVKDPGGLRRGTGRAR